MVTLICELQKLKIILKLPTTNGVIEGEIEVAICLRDPTNCSSQGAAENITCSN